MSESEGVLFQGIMSAADGNNYVVLFDYELGKSVFYQWKNIPKKQRDNIRRHLEPYQLAMVKNQLRPFIVDIKVCAKQIWEFSTLMHQTITESKEQDSKLGKALESTVAANFELSERILFDSLSLVTFPKEDVS